MVYLALQNHKASREAQDARVALEKEKAHNREQQLRAEIAQLKQQAGQTSAHARARERMSPAREFSPPSPSYKPFDCAPGNSAGARE
jgi:hypothetical protein